MQENLKIRKASVSYLLSLKIENIVFIQMGLKIQFHKLLFIVFHSLFIPIDITHTVLFINDVLFVKAVIQSIKRV